MSKKYFTCVVEPNRTANRLPMVRWSRLLLRQIIQRDYLGIATQITERGPSRGNVAALQTKRQRAEPKVSPDAG